ncbi:MAG: hypothetical protein R3208_20270 [Ketobacteraceae bacterium]|nr:hypothetical protein [Ketobacteraceae bacterium]
MENSTRNRLKRIFADELKFLFFRPFRIDLSIFNWYLAFGITFSWLCGIGRYWDNPRAELWQYVGLGSVAYIFILALILWLVIWPLKPKRWSYKNVLLFVAMTSPPAILYAIPVERFMDLRDAQTVNVWFLAVVATWRVALLVRYLKTVAGLSEGSIIVATLLPLTLIISILAFLNLEHVVFRIMAGLEDHERSANDAAYGILMLITYFSVFALPFLLSGYLTMVIKMRRKK